MDTTLGPLPPVFHNNDYPVLIADIVDLGSGMVRLLHADGWWVELSHLPKEIKDALAELDGAHSLSKISHRLPKDHHAPFVSCITELARSGLLITPPSACGRVAVVGDGPLGLALIEAVRKFVTLIVTDAFGSWVSARIANGSPRQFSSDASLVPISHWSELSFGDVDLVVVASRTIEPDRAMIDHVSRRDLPYLVVRAHRDVAVVGPLVDGVSGTCLTCHDLMLADDDSAWPRTLQTLSHISAVPSQTVTAWASNVAAARVPWFVNSSSTDLFSTTLHMSIQTPGTQRRLWRVHRDCSCQLDPTAVSCVA